MEGGEKKTSFQPKREARSPTPQKRREITLLGRAGGFLRLCVKGGKKGMKAHCVIERRGESVPCAGLYQICVRRRKADHDDYGAAGEKRKTCTHCLHHEAP